MIQVPHLQFAGQRSLMALRTFLYMAHEQLGTFIRLDLPMPLTEKEKFNSPIPLSYLPLHFSIHAFTSIIPAVARFSSVQKDRLSAAHPLLFNCLYYAIYLRYDDSMSRSLSIYSSVVSIFVWPISSLRSSRGICLCDASDAKVLRNRCGCT